MIFLILKALAECTTVANLGLDSDPLNFNCNFLADNACCFCRGGC